MFRVTDLLRKTMLGMTVAAFLLTSCSSQEPRTESSAPATSSSTDAERSSAETADTVAGQSVEINPPSEVAVGLSPDRLAKLVALRGDYDGSVGVYTRDHNTGWLTPWLAGETPDEDLLVFESEIGISPDQIDAVAPSGGLVVAAFSDDPDDVVERVVTASPWADLATVETIGEFELIGFGTTLDLNRKSLLRPIGQPGELAITDGFMIWSPRAGEVRSHIERGPSQRYTDVALEVAKLSDWTVMLADPSRSVDEIIYDCDTCDYESTAAIRDYYTQFGNPVRFESSTLIQKQGDSEFVILIEHATPELAAMNAIAIPEIFDQAVDYPNSRPLAEEFDLNRVQVSDSFVILDMTERLAIPPDFFYLTPLLTWDD